MKQKTLIIILLGFLFLTACASADPAEEATDPKEVVLVAEDIAYDQNRIEVEAGRPVHLTLDNQGLLEHDFSVAEIPVAGEVKMTMSHDATMTHDMDHMAAQPALHVAALAGRSSSIEFTPSTAGEYEYFCTVPGHREVGMAGTIIVQ